MCNHVDPSTRRSSSHRAASRQDAIQAKLIRAIALGLLCVFGTACKTVPAPESSSDRFETFSSVPNWSVASFGPGDVVSVTVQGHPELSTPLSGARLDESGSLILPTVGPVKLQGTSLSEARERVHAAYAKFMLDPDVLVDVMSRASSQYFLLGQISEPGPRVMERPTTALEAVSNGSYFLNGADRKRVFVVRPHGEEIEVHQFNAATPDPLGLVQIKPGDIVFVRRRGAQRFQEEFLPLLAPFQIFLPAAAISGAL
jgi:polysaccharide export outer membrane protein